MPTKVVKDVTYTLKAGTPAFRTLEALQTQFAVTKKNNDGKEVTTRLQGRVLLGAIVEAVLRYASEETLTALAEEAKDLGDDKNKGKATQYLQAVFAARAVKAATVKSVADASIEELEAEIERKKAAMAPGAKTKDVKAL